MSEYKRQIATGAVVAVLCAAILAFGALSYLPAQQSSTTIVSTVTNTMTTATSVVTSTQTVSSSTSVTTTLTTTIPAATTYTNQTVPLDNRLEVSPIGSLGSSNNATTYAEALASNLGEIPVRLVSQQQPTCSGGPAPCGQSAYVFKTARDSNITVDFVNGSFYQLQYEVENYSALYNGYWNAHSYGNPPTTAEDVAVGNLMLKAFNLDLSRVTLDDNTTGPGWALWTQEYNGLQIANGGQIYFEVYPPTSAIIRLLIVEGAGWYQIPSGFPLDTTSSAALGAARAYATSAIHMGFIVYAGVSWQIVRDHLYYAATISDQMKTYVLFVNPATGEVGLPAA